MQIDEVVSSLLTAEHLARQVNPRELSKPVLDGIDQHTEFIIWGNACWLRVPHTILRFPCREEVWQMDPCDGASKVAA